MNAARSARLEEFQAERAGDSALALPPLRPHSAYLEARFEAIALELAGHFPHLDLEDDDQALR